MTVLLRVLALAVPAVGLAELALHLHHARRAPALDEWAALAPAVTELRKDGDLTIVAPAWAEPNARWALGDEVFPLRDVARADETGYSRAVEISILGQRSPEVSAWTVLEERGSGRFTLRVLENPAPPTVRLDFTDALGPEKVEVFERVGDRVVDCPWTNRARMSAGGLGGNPTFPRERFACPSGEFFFAGVTVIDDERYRPRRCVWAHPPARGSLVLRYRDVPLGRVVRGYGGLPWIIERAKPGTPVAMEVSLDGRSLGKLEHADGEGWKPFELPTGAEGRSGTVEFSVSSSNAAHRHFCFQADTR